MAFTLAAFAGGGKPCLLTEGAGPTNGEHPAWAGLSLESMSMKIERVLKRAAAELGEKELVIRVSPDVAVYLLEERGSRLERLERRLGIQLDIVDDPALRREDFRIITKRGKKDVTAQFES